MHTTDWRVQVVRDPTSFNSRVYLFRDLGTDTQIVNGDGTITSVPYGDPIPDGAGIALPSDAWEALVEFAAAQSHLGAEARVLREWLKHEQSRVDSALGTARR